MDTWQLVCLPVCLAGRQAASLPACLPACPPARQPARLPACPPARLPACAALPTSCRAAWLRAWLACWLFLLARLGARAFGRDKGVPIVGIPSDSNNINNINDSNNSNTSNNSIGVNISGAPGAALCTRSRTPARQPCRPAGSLL